MCHLLVEAGDLHSGHFANLCLAVCLVEQGRQGLGHSQPFESPGRGDVHFRTSEFKELDQTCGGRLVIERRQQQRRLFQPAPSIAGEHLHRRGAHGIMQFRPLRDLIQRLAHGAPNRPIGVIEQTRHDGNPIGVRQQEVRIGSAGY